jgi:3-hydroxyanthranilate 3,4-dioxygenase
MKDSYFKNKAGSNLSKKNRNFSILLFTYKTIVMPVASAFNLKKWIDENRGLLKPPVGNQCIYKEAEDFIVMVVGGPNARKDYHFNETEELYYQIEGDIVLKIIDDGVPRDIAIREGDIFLLPPKTPHSPRRPANTVGLVIEKLREEEEDAFMWYCENCGNKLYEERLVVTDIVKQLPPVMDRFYSSIEKRTCSHCGTIMEPPKKV